jgi:hypothetical protein
MSKMDEQTPLQRATQLLLDTQVGMYPESYPAAEQVRAGVIEDESQAFTEDSPRAWDVDMMEFVADAVVEVHGVLDALPKPEKLSELRASCEYDPYEEGPVDALIAYKDALEDLALSAGLLVADVD